MMTIDQILASKDISVEDKQNAFLKHSFAFFMDTTIERSNDLLPEFVEALKQCKWDSPLIVEGELQKN